MADAGSCSAAVTMPAFEAAKTLSNTLASGALIIKNQCGEEINMAWRLMHGPSPLANADSQVVTIVQVL